MNSNLEEQMRMCARFSAPFCAAPAGLKVGISETVLGDMRPLNGLRHPLSGDASGWYIWAGELSDDADFFKPLHVAHLSEWSPGVVPYLGLPPGWRFQIAEGHEDVWFDSSLLMLG